MGALVITKDSWLSCSHGPPPGANIANNGVPSKLRVDGVEVMLVGDLAGVAVSNCPQPESSSTLPCEVATRTSGDAQKLTVGGTAVLTADTGGTTTGLPAPPPPAKGFLVTDPRQTRLRTV
jgi:hypothetical protein